MQATVNEAAAKMIEKQQPWSKKETEESENCHNIVQGNNKELEEYINFRRLSPESKTGSLACSLENVSKLRQKLNIENFTLAESGFSQNMLHASGTFGYADRYGYASRVIWLIVFGHHTISSFLHAYTHNTESVLHRLEVSKL